MSESPETINALLGPLVFAAALGLGAFALLVVSARMDRFLGALVLASLLVRLIGCIVVGIYLESRHGRAYTGGDEIAYLDVGEQILSSLQSAGADRAQRAIPGSYPHWNAAVIAIWGRSLVPLRLANSLIASAGIVVAFMLARRLFGTDFASRAAALAVALSPSLMIWSLMNLKDTMLAVGCSVALLAGIMALSRPGPAVLACFTAVLLALGTVSRHYAAVIGWLALTVMALAPAPGLRAKLLRVGLMTVTVALVLYVVSGSVMGIGLTVEKIGRQLPDSRAEYAEFPPLPGRTLGNLPFVVFGRFAPRGDVGLVQSALLFPEWLAFFAVVPLACWGLARALRIDVWSAGLVGGFAGCMIVILAWVHGDAWTTYRHKAATMPVLLVLAAGGADAVRVVVARWERSDAVQRLRQWVQA